MRKPICIPKVGLGCLSLAMVASPAACSRPAGDSWAKVEDHAVSGELGRDQRQGSGAANAGWGAEPDAGFDDVEGELGDDREGGGDSWQHRLVSAGLVELVPSKFRRRAGFDCVAIISIDRAEPGVEPYIYQTLPATLRALAPGAEVNIMVSDERAGYLCHERIAYLVGEDQARHVHVHAVNREVAETVRARCATSRARATWNVARLLRSYRGTQGLLVLEDDISWTQQGVRPLTHAMAAVGSNGPPLLSLFNRFCDGLADAPAPMPRTPEIVRSDTSVHRFHYAQGLRYSPQMARRGGRHLESGLPDSDYYDSALGDFLPSQGWQVGYLYPSIIQHVGVHSSQGNGVGNGPVSTCMLGDEVD